MSGNRSTAWLLPHEAFFGAFLVTFWLRLAVTAGPADPDACLYAGAILANAAVIAWCVRHPTTPRWHLRLWFYPVAMNVLFLMMGSAVGKIMPHKYDTLLASFDRWLFGATLSERAAMVASPILTEILSFCYLLFFPYLLFSWIYYASRGLPLLRNLMVGMFTIYGLGFLGYSLIPAGGPHLALPDAFPTPLTGWAITRFNDFVVANGSNGVDVFPSLHCAISCYLLGFDRRHAPWRFRLYMIPCCGLWLATIYLRYHYLADVIAGFALAAFALWLANRWEHNSGSSKEPPPPP